MMTSGDARHPEARHAVLEEADAAAEHLGQNVTLSRSSSSAASRARMTLMLARTTMSPPSCLRRLRTSSAGSAVAMREFCHGLRESGREDDLLRVAGIRRSVK